jgi:hypothetical protein
MAEKARKFGCDDRVKHEGRKTDGWQQTNSGVPFCPVMVD